MRKALGLLLILCVVGLAHAQVLKPASWKVSTSGGNQPKVGEEISVVFDVEIDDRWYLYSNDFDPDLGPTVTEFSFEPHESYELLGEPQPIHPKRKYDSLWEGEVSIFYEQAQFVQKVSIKDPQFVIKGTYSYQVCSDVDGKCILFEEEFELTGTKKKAPVDKPEIIVDAKTDKGLLEVFMVALVAGLIALATPCVYPMIPMTVSVFMKQGGSRAKGVSLALVFGVSIILLFTVIGLIVSLVWGFSALNELSTNWLFNILLFGVFVLFALSFFGLFEITLPHTLVNKIDQQADRGGFIGVVFMAITLVVVSFSCTVPIVSSALLASLNGDVVYGTVTMFGFSLAFAIPFTAFALFPRWLKSLPKSGGWLNSVKVVLGFLELAFALKFLSVADLAYHWGILDRPVFIAIWIVLFVLLGFYLLGKIRFKGDSPLEFVSIGRLFLSIGVFSFASYLVPGLFGAPLKALAGFLPPLHTHDFNLKATANSSGTVSTVEKRHELCEDPLYADFLHWPHGLSGYFDYDQALACARASNKPVFVDFTGHGCVNCREMEARVWSEPTILSRLRSDFVLLALYVDDKTELPREKWYTSSYDHKVKKSIGKQNADFQITGFNNNAQPFYLILTPDGDLLTNPSAYDLNVPNFVAFLDNGKKAFQKR